MAAADVFRHERDLFSPGEGGFVIQFRCLADVEQECFAGRVEHVASGEVEYFRSAEELVGFVRNVLHRRRPEASV